ncbi:uncharacterized protein PFL1_04148 [Pseudozyma flocculosa PF-1]|uniref:Uncharacterized protein n=1 Tax=Pseudozyma flocculosa PF-1 TaxID=1277687 RepID=A0A061HCI3_9BASI|nr:uncharacterized protein PFL1_04148 [Pseudozyma flocculosa PF-1]EPQ28321.1 hypothetical protein PFL1_04148 [Pseudozyma flocculosa PF-1]
MNAALPRAGPANQTADIVFSGGDPYSWPEQSDWKIWDSGAVARVASGGSAVYTQVPRATLKFDFRGRQLSIAFVAFSRPSSVAISIDGGAVSRTVEITTADADELSVAASRQDVIKVVFDSLVCANHSVTLTNTSPAAVATKTARLTFDAYSFLPPGDEPCGSLPLGGEGKDDTVDVIKEPAPFPPTPSPARRDQDRPQDVAKVAGIAVGSVFAVAALVTLFAWIIRRQLSKRKAVAGDAVQKSSSGQGANARWPWSRTSALVKGDGSAKSRENGADSADPFALVRDSKTSPRPWTTLYAASFGSSLKSAPATPSKTSPAEADPNESIIAPYGQPPPRTPPPSPGTASRRHDSPGHPPGNKWSSPKRVGFITTRRDADSASRPFNIVARSGLMDRAGQRPWKAPDGQAPLPSFGATGKVARRPDQLGISIRPRTSSLSTSGGALGNTASVRPATASAVEHFNRGRAWVEIDRPLSSFRARSDHVKALNSRAPSTHERLVDTISSGPWQDGARPSRDLDAEAPTDRQTPEVSAFPHRPPKSPLRANFLSAAGEASADDSALSRNRYEYDTVDEQSMWRTPSPASTADPTQNLNKALQRGTGREHDKDPSEDGAIRFGDAKARTTTIGAERKDQPLPAVPDQGSERRVKTRASRLIEHLDDDFGTDVVDGVRRMLADGGSSGSHYSRESYDEGESREDAADSRISHSDLSIWRSDATVMSLVRAKAPRLGE